jgi:hypothetical protein
MPNKAPRKTELLAGVPALGESHKVIVACNDWLRWGPGRDMKKLAEQYQRTPGSPTTKHGTLRTWSVKYGWPGRAEEYDGAIEYEKNARMAEERRLVMEEGIGLDFKRVARLKAIEADLYAQYFFEDDKGDRTKLWLPDVKQIGSGEDAERVDIVRFNAALVEQIRGVLSDVASEKGERKLRVESSSIAVNISAEDLSSAQSALDQWEKKHAPLMPSMPSFDEQEDREPDEDEDGE